MIQNEGRIYRTNTKSRALVRQQRAIQQKGLRNDPIAEDHTGWRHHIHRKGR